MFFSGVLFPIFVLMSIAIDEPGPLIVPIVTFIVGLTILLYSRLFSEEFPLINSQQSQRFGIGAMSGQALPPASSTPIYTAGTQRVRTNELAQPPSVTEQTTKLLDQE